MSRANTKVKLSESVYTLAQAMSTVWPNENPGTPLSQKTFTILMQDARHLLPRKHYPNEIEALRYPEDIWSALKDPLLGTYEFSDGTLTFNCRPDSVSDLMRRNPTLYDVLQRVIQETGA